MSIKCYLNEISRFSLLEWLLIFCCSVAITLLMVFFVISTVRLVLCFSPLALCFYLGFIVPTILSLGFLSFSELKTIF